MHLSRTSLTSLFSVVVVATACGSHEDGATSAVAPDAGGGTTSSTPVGTPSGDGGVDASVVTGAGAPDGGGDAGSGDSGGAVADAGPKAPAVVDPAVQLQHVQAAGKVFTAQYLDGFDDDPDNTITGLTSEGAPMPAGIGVPRTAFGVMNTRTNTSLYYLHKANTYLAAGNQVMVSVWSGNPNDFNRGGGYMCPGPSNQPGTGGEDLGESDSFSPLSASDFADVSNPDTALGKAWTSTLDLYAADLAQLEGIVLFRVLLEMNGQNGKWWNDQKPADYIALWRYTHDYLNQTKGLAAKLRWVWAINAGEGNYATYYPGDDQVDVVGLDAYGPDARIYTGQVDDEGKSAMASLFTHGKPVILAETGCPGSPPADNTCDYTALLAQLKQGAAATGLPLPAAMYVWWQGWSLDVQNGGAVAGKATAFLNDPVMVNRSELASYN